MNKLILEAFDSGGWVRYNKSISRSCGLEAAIMLGFLIDKYVYWSGVDKDSGKNRYFKVTGSEFKGEFFCIRSDIENELGISPHIQRKGLESLRKHGIIKTSKKGLPQKIYYSIDFEELEFLLVETFNIKSLKSSTTKNEQNQRLAVDGFDNTNNKVIRLENKEQINSTTSIEVDTKASTSIEVKEIEKVNESISAQRAVERARSAQHASRASSSSKKLPTTLGPIERSIIEKYKTIFPNNPIRLGDIKAFGSRTEDELKVLDIIIEDISLFHHPKWDASTKDLAYLIGFIGKFSSTVIKGRYPSSKKLAVFWDQLIDEQKIESSENDGKE